MRMIAVLVWHLMPFYCSLSGGVLSGEVADWFITLYEQRLLVSQLTYRPKKCLASLMDQIT